MTRKGSSRLAGFALLFYIAVGVPAMVLSGRATSGADVPAKLARIASHLPEMRIALLLTLLGTLMALALAVSLFAITRDEDADVARLGMVCRVAEGLVGAASIPGTAVLMWLGTTTGPGAPDPATARAVGAFLFGVLGRNGTVSATFFAVGSTAFSWLMLRGRIVPAGLAGLGVGASLLLVVGLPLQLVGLLPGLLGSLMWLPMLAFEVPVALWLLVRGAASPRPRAAA